jgi:[glutamine synthetase] adenylyltransferase / [glutamine synthetase]-adenylyl-L-tyrosine phosphorylase
MMREAVAGAGGFEAALNAVRRLHREEAFRIDWQTLAGRAPPEAAGAAHADLAEACVSALAGAAAAETARRLGPAPGAFTVLALGKFGGRELAQGSDLDLMVVYDAPDGTGSDYFTRLTQRLIAALSAPTEEGLLYDVDMQLRPSGSKGPVAVSKAAFQRYYDEEAWTWELLALTRLRAVAGDAALGAQVEALAHGRLARPMDRAAIFADVASMRARMDKERPAKGRWDLKLSPGGFVDVEFIAQAMQLVTAARASDVLHPNTSVALAALTAAGALAWDDAEPLLAGWRLYSQLQQWVRIVWEGPFRPEAAGEAVCARLARALRRPDFAAVERELAQRQQACRATFTALMAP